MVSKYTAYRIVHCGDAADVDQVGIGKLLAEGWELYSEPLVRNNTVYQVMVKRKATLDIDPVMSFPVQELRAGIRLYNSLSNAGFETVREIVEYPFHQITHIPKLGMKQKNELREELLRIGVPAARLL